MGHPGLSLICLVILALAGAPKAAAARDPGGTPHSCDEISQRHSIDARNLDTRVLESSLLDAAAAGCMDLIGTLLDHGASIGARDQFGNTPLLIAAKMNQHETAEILLKTGADPNEANSSGIAPLTSAIFKGNERLVALLLEANVRAETLDAGARAGSPDKICEVPRASMVYAARKGYAGIVAKLLDSGLDVNARYDRAWTALMLAASHNSGVRMTEGFETAKLLLHRSADVDSTNDLGRTALMIAAKRNHVEIVTLLLERGADPLHMDFQGESAMELTQSRQVLDELARAVRVAKPITNQ